LERLNTHCLGGRRLWRAPDSAGRTAKFRAGNSSRGLSIIVGCLQAILFAGSVRADVLDVSSSGLVTVYDRPAIFRSEDVRPIVAARSLPRRQAVMASPSAQAVGALLAQASNRYAIRADLLTSVAWQESHFQSGAISPKGAVGVMQLMDGTARDLGVNRFDLSQNIFGGAAYLKQMLERFGGDETLALAAYNAGPQAVLRAGGVPQIAETRGYVSAILGAPPGQPSLILIDR
jgi:soluble lytic murein transglycosylase-like protein